MWVAGLDAAYTLFRVVSRSNLFSVLENSSYIASEYENTKMLIYTSPILKKLRYHLVCTCVN